MSRARYPDMNFKTKIRLVLLLFFSIVTVLGVLGGYYLDRIAGNSVAMMNTNLRTLNHTQEMFLALNESISILSTQDLTSKDTRVQLRKSFDRFELFLSLQSDIITEEEEENLLEALRADFENFKLNIRQFEPQGEVPIEVLMTSLNMQGILKQVYEINRESIQKKNDWAYKQATRVTLAIILFGFFFFVFAVLALFFFPDSIARPLQQLAEGIREISRKNYSQRLEVRTRDEFGEVAASFNTMAKKLEEYEGMNIAQLLTEKRRIETIIGEMNEPIIGLDPDRVVLFANTKALELIGMEEKAVLGKPVDELALHNEKLREVVRETPPGRTYPTFSLIQKGKTYYFEKDVLDVSADGEPGSDGSVIILKNITEFKEQDLAKTNFMATLSHELKTPISAIDMSLGLLQDERIGSLNQDQAELTQTIRDNAYRLLSMVNEILDLSKIETGIMELSMEETRVEGLVQRALENTDIFLAEKGIRVERKIEENLPALRLDPQKTIAVLTNFLTNAIRYSPKGGHICIEVQRQRDEVLFTVTDEGPGIPEDDQQRIFQRYSRSQNDRTKGTGLGLAISKEFIEKQGGRIWLKSKVGEGSTFGFAFLMS